MIVGVMQPYLFPYIGYWQLLDSVDTFVVFDDVNYINKGWINRNRILVSGQPKFFNVQMHNASQNQLINEVMLTNSDKETAKQLRTVELAYKKAPYFQDVFPLFSDCMTYHGKNLSDFVTNSIRKTAAYLGCRTDIILSSDMEKDNRLHGQEKVLDICKKLNANEYRNPIGGLELYDRQRFADNGIRLFFIQSNENLSYNQFKNQEFIPWLSIIDIMMFCSKDQLHELLKQYTLV